MFSSPKQQTPPADAWAGPQWEYRVEEFRSGPVMGTDVARRLASLGAQGWEVVAIHDDAVTAAKIGDRAFSAFMKRPIL